MSKNKKYMCRWGARTSCVNAATRITFDQFGRALEVSNVGAADIESIGIRRHDASAGGPKELT